MIHIALHGSRCCACHLIHACDERFSSTLSPPFSFTSSSSHSFFISCTSSRTSSTSLRAVASLCTPPKKGMDSLDDSYLPHRLWAQRLRPQGDVRRVLHRVPDLTAVLQAKVPRGRRVRWHRTRGYASRSTPSTCLSLLARRLVCRSVVVCVRKNGAICLRANGATCWIN